MITEDQVVDAYRKSLRLRARMHRDDNETAAEFDERLSAIAEFDTIELQYLAQETR